MPRRATVRALVSTQRASDGLPARTISPHTREKFQRQESYCAIFNGSMRKKYAHNRGYLELFAGPGLAIDAGEEVDGCPLIAAASEPPFARLAFVEDDLELAGALEERLRRRGLGPDRAQVFAGDANDPATLRAALDFLPSPGLIFGFIDPEDINGDWDAIRFLAARRAAPHWQRIDFLVNLPIGPMKRNYKHDAKITRALGTDEWIARVAAGELLGPVFRETMAAQFKSIGLRCAEHMPIRAVGSNAVVYDLVFASGHELGIAFWKKIAAVTPSGQTTLQF